ncbi:MAG TPA: deoxyribonuclease IV [Candidatus Onthovivens sp.]|nr:deoxyribonuclease IV [Candidatus Onthovivens sp.]
MENNLIIGSHVSMSDPDYFYGTIEETIKNGANALMFYTGAPQNSRRTDLEKCKIDEALELANKNGLSSKHFICHAPYIINLANRTDESKFQFALDVLINEINRTAVFKCKFLVLHPGSHVGSGVEVGLANIIYGINQALKRTNGVTILLETMAGKGSECGTDFQQIKRLIDNIDDKSRIGVCLDTCHIHDSGYDVNTDIIGLFDEVIGLDYLKCIHLNDSKNELESHKDRHENIGFGTIGFENLMKFVYDPRTSGIPKILETPFINKQSPYKKEIEMIRANKFNPKLKNQFN